MRGILIRIFVVIITFLLSITWFPYSLLPLWLLICVLNFFGLREGLILFVGFGLLALATGLTWYGIPSITILWLTVIIFMVITNISHTKTINIPTLLIMSVSISILFQIWAYGWNTTNAISILFWTSLKHVLLVALLTPPTKIFGEAYARYLNALGINYE